ncbi:hypothetical protein CANCADRAFT_29437 [Tortispora caseinolytica NRRL Y-17796]|uniref:non-specific serine/threonine protein kinase n=1 Tax=Tortispora caseinolytica NRRL Y-17796 TaxID=767744 RepID=A0A1E4TA86_9ASCO|nr:hypothetical protein CANCADRAFT_29437 [Tortispora caseinolytica NRRL Y-17796]
MEALVRSKKKKTIADFIVLEELGQGAYGKVMLVQYKAAPAIKVLMKYVIKKRILVDTWIRDRKLGTVPLEIHVLVFLRQVPHPNIINLLDFFEDEENYYIEMEPHGVPGMDLFDYIEFKTDMTEDESCKIFYQVASAIAHLHDNGIVHRDIKDENVILDSNGSIKLIDFGSAVYVKNGPFDVFVGTIDYAAPEVLLGRPYNGKEQDVWAAGILLYTIVYKENPFYNVDEILSGELRVPYVLSDGCLDLIKAMLERSPARRITMDKVLQHPWFASMSS